MVKLARPRAATTAWHPRRRHLGSHANTLHPAATVMLPELTPARRASRFRTSPCHPDVSGRQPQPILQLRCVRSPEPSTRYYAEAYAYYRDRLEPVAAYSLSPSRPRRRSPSSTTRSGAGSEDHQCWWHDPSWPYHNVPGRAVVAGHAGYYLLNDHDRCGCGARSLKRCATFHSGGQGWDWTASTTNNSYNQVGNFSSPLTRTPLVVFGGCPRRLLFAFQEGGVAISCPARGHCLHCKKRRIDDLSTTTRPTSIGGCRVGCSAPSCVRGHRRPVEMIDEALVMLSDSASDVDQFGVVAATSVDDLFRHVHEPGSSSGAEADDPMNVLRPWGRSHRRPTSGDVRACEVLVLRCTSWSTTGSSTQAQVRASSCSSSSGGVLKLYLHGTESAVAVVVLVTPCAGVRILDLSSERRHRAAGQPRRRRGPGGVRVSVTC